MKKTELIYLYDGNFISLLNLINKLFHEQTIPLKIKDNHYNPNLFEQTINIKIPENDTIVSKIIAYYGIQIFNGMYYLFLSHNEDKELLIFYFWLYSIKYGNQIFIRRDIPIISKAIDTINYVSRENHKMKGFLRFKELKSHFLYAKMAPENNVLPLLVKHFMKRLKNENWMIEDEKRKIMAIYDNHKLMLVASNLVKIDTDLATNEEQMEKLWQTFYQTISIASRENEKCRRNFMPKKYWKYILEVSQEK